MNRRRTIVMLNNDFRLHDHPALYNAVNSGDVIPVFIYEEEDQEKWSIGAAKKWWLHQCLHSFQQSLHEVGGKLWIFKGTANEILPRLIEETRAEAVYWNRSYHPEIYKSHIKLAKELSNHNLEIQTFEGITLLPPWSTTRKEHEPYRVFTPFYKAFPMKSVPQAYPSIKRMDTPNITLNSLMVEDLDLLPKEKWPDFLETAWEPTEEKAIQIFKHFCEEKLGHYGEDRDIPSREGFSKLSPYLAMGMISARSMFHYLLDYRNHTAFIRQLIWRDYAYQFLYYFPHSTTLPLQELFKEIRWNDDEDRFDAWKKGSTGFPFIDAGMRELWGTGYLPNRVRMVVASFLVKDLLIPWQKGAEWFWDTLIDADLANNTMGWQWVAGSGVDASPYFRIFNPATQSKRFDPDGAYIKKWVPELKDLPKKYIHEPWNAPDDALAKAGITLGKTYPLPIVDHAAARKRALDRYEEIKNK
ncbi:cryptochrome/photolyase family protein [Falsibacillus albus]|uniref:Deoxyribodipyrimidine photo-lyase n=1 Tax=Falsibacillus albus TaxID=2478915 RepID=A0A3L7K2P9_9BACI|nr:deoxyribodipyrimidine photo-lyase [Falsibacillus albus]RLQ97346.1 deoxyribodipyrimidine photo-lyase [Falsibacillus albus]